MLDSLLRLRMPTTIHEALCERLTKEINSQLEVIACRADDDSVFALAILSVGLARIYLREFDLDEDVEVLQRELDKQFQHNEATYPSVVIKISYSQRSKDLRKLAKEYILHSNSEIKAVIGLYVDYGNNPEMVAKEARISVWEPSYTKEGEHIETLTVKESVSCKVSLQLRIFLKRQMNLTIPKLFCGPQGQLVNPKIALPLDLFATSSIRSHNPASPTITIAYAKLAKIPKRSRKIGRSADNCLEAATSRREIIATDEKEKGSLRR